MVPKIHILIGGLVSVLIVYFFNVSIFGGLLIFLSSFLIDFDHYVYYVFKEKDLNPFNSVKWFFRKRDKWFKLSVLERKGYKRGIFIFHGIEFLLLLFLVSWFYPVFYYVIFGILIHIFLDYVEILHLNEPLYSKFSPFLVSWFNKGKVMEV